MLKIGDFARLGQVYIVTLRHYDECGSQNISSWFQLAIVLMRLPRTSGELLVHFWKITY